MEYRNLGTCKPCVSADGLGCRSMSHTYRETSAQVLLTGMFCKRPWTIHVPGTGKFKFLQMGAGPASIKFHMKEVRIGKTPDEMKMSELSNRLKIRG